MTSNVFYSSFWKPTATMNQNFQPTVICTWRWPHFPPLQSFPPSSPDCLPPISLLQNPVVISALFHYPFCSKAAVAWLMNDDSEHSNKNTWCKWAVSSVILWCLIIVTSWHFPLKVSSCNFISLWLYISGILCAKRIVQLKWIFHHFVGSGSGEIF